MIGARINLDDRDIREGLAALERAGKDLRPVLKRLRVPLRRDLKEHAARESGEDGRWPRRSPVTEVRLKERAAAGAVRVQRKRKRKRKVKASTTLLGQLPGSVTFRTSKRALIAASPVKWSGAHNDGAIVGRRSVLPKREFVFLSDGWLDLANQSVLDYVVERGWERG